jgi:hypothetical protein
MRKRLPKNYDQLRERLLLGERFVDHHGDEWFPMPEGQKGLGFQYTQGPEDPEPWRMDATLGPFEDWEFTRLRLKKPRPHYPGCARTPAEVAADLESADVQAATTSMKPLPPPRVGALVLVAWKDIQTESGWVEAASNELELAEVEVVGWVLSTDAESLTLAAMRSGDVVNLRATLPWVLVRSVQVLRQPGEPVAP